MFTGTATGTELVDLVDRVDWSPPFGEDIDMNQTNGKVALVRSNKLLTCNGPACDGAKYIDLVGYGSTANYWEGFEAGDPHGAPAASRALSSHRKVDGCQDTDSNMNDFYSATPSPKTSNDYYNCSEIPDAGTDADAEVDAEPDVDADAGPPESCLVEGGSLVIAEVYGGGGGLTGGSVTYQHDYVIIYNRGDEPMPLGELSVQYAGQGQAFSTSERHVGLEDVELGPGQYYYIQMLDEGTPGSVATIDPNLIAVPEINMSASNGKVALVRTDSLLTCNAGCSGPQIIDLVGYGTANSYEGSAAADGLTSLYSAQRKLGGTVDTDDNKNDFFRATPNPRNTDDYFDCLGEVDAGTDAGTDAEPDAPEEGGTDADADASAPDPVAQQIVIAEIYGGGASTGALYKNDYVILYNRTTEPAELGGLTIQYAGVNGNFNSNPTATANTELPSFVLKPGKYFMVWMGGGTGGDDVPSLADHTGSTQMSATQGKVALVRSSALLGACGGSSAPKCILDDGNVMDLIGYGKDASQFEGEKPAPGIEVTKSAIRKLGGCQDTDENGNDIDPLDPQPRNNSLPANICEPGDAGDGGADDGSDDGDGGGSGGGGGAGGEGGVGGAGGDTGGTGATGGEGGTTGGSGGSGAGSGGDLVGGNAGNAGTGAGGSDSKTDPTEGEYTQEGGGCGCSVPGQNEKTAGGFILAALGMLGLAIRRRRD